MSLEKKPTTFLLKDLVIALSSANLFYVGVWRRLLSGTHVFVESEPAAVHFVAAITGISIFALGILGLFRSASRLRQEEWSELVRYSILFLAAVFALADLSRSHEKLGPLINSPLVLALFVIVGAIVFLFWRRPVTTFAHSAFLILSPFVLVTFGQATYMIFVPSKLQQASTAAAISADSGVSTDRVVWIIFDELDGYQGFIRRPDGVQMEAFDRLRLESVFTASAIPPGNATMISIPALTTGLPVTNAVPEGPSHLRLTVDGLSNRVLWSEQDSIFKKARRAGFSSAIVGWFLPYCRIFRDHDVSSCAWYPDTADLVLSLPETSLGQAMFTQFKVFLRTVPFLRDYAVAAGRVQAVNQMMVQANKEEERRKHLETYRFLMKDAMRAVNTSGFNLTLIHLPVPHVPGIFDRKSGQLSVDKDRNYLDNLVLADKTLNDLRTAMEASGLWDKTTVVVTSDHSWRASTHRRGLLWTAEEESVYAVHTEGRVPLFVKFPGQRKSVELSTPFKLIEIEPALLRILKGEIRTADDFLAWHAKRYELDSR